jgi:hypothetical protein
MRSPRTSRRKPSPNLRMTHRAGRRSLACVIVCSPEPPPVGGSLCRQCDEDWNRARSVDSEHLRGASIIAVAVTAAPASSAADLRFAGGAPVRQASRMPKSDDRPIPGRTAGLVVRHYARRLSCASHLWLYPPSV